MLLPAYANDSDGDDETVGIWKCKLWNYLGNRMDQSADLLDAGVVILHGEWR